MEKRQGASLSSVGASWGNRNSGWRGIIWSKVFR